ncbi:MAG: TraB/GumN family protein [Rhizomicrobium sp.]
MSRAAAIAACATVLMAASPPPAAPPITDWSNIETVIVTAKPPGPALWHVARGNSEVWILGTVAPTPIDLKWDTSEIAALMKGSNILLLPPRGQVGVFEGAWFLLTGMGTLEQPDGKTLESSLQDPLKSRFVAARARVHRDPDRYDKYLPAVAALILEADFWKASKLNFNGPQKTVESLAGRAAVPARPIAVYPAMDVIHDVPKMSPAAHLACLEDALSDIDIESDHAVAAAQAWAVGNLEGIKANYSETKLDACMQQNNAYSVLREKATGDMANAIAGALKKPGKSFAVIPMGIWLRKGGVLDRLEAAGLTVSGPGG